MYKNVGPFRWRLKIDSKDVTNRLLKMRVIQKMPQDLLFTVSMPLYQLHIDLVDVKLGDISKGLKVYIVEDTDASVSRFLLPLFFIDSVSVFEGRVHIVCLPFFVLRSFSKSVHNGVFYSRPDIVPAISGDKLTRQPCMPTLDGYFSAISTPVLGDKFPPVVSLYSFFASDPSFGDIGASRVFALNKFMSFICFFDSDSIYSIESVAPLPPVGTVLKPDISYSSTPVPLFEFTGLRGSFGHLWYFMGLGKEFLFLVRPSLSVVRVLFSSSKKVYVFSVPEEAEFAGYLGYSYVLFSMPDHVMVIDCFSGKVVFEYKGSLLLSYAPSEAYFSSYLDANSTMLFSLLSLSKGPDIIALFVIHSAKGSKFYTATLSAIDSSLATAFNKGVIHFKSSHVVPSIDIEVYFVENEGHYYVLCVNYPKNKYACVPLDFSSKPLNSSLGIKGAFCMRGNTLGLVIHSDGYRYEINNILRFSSTFDTMYKGNPKITFEKTSAFYAPVIAPKTLPGVHTYTLEEGYSSLSDSFYKNTFEQLKKSFVKDKRYYETSDGSFYVSSRVKYRPDLILFLSPDSSRLQVFRPSSSKEDAVLCKYVPTVRLFDDGLNVSVPTSYPLPASVLQVFSSWNVKDIVAGQFLHKKDAVSDWIVYKISPNRILPLGAPVKFIDTDGIEKEGRIVSSEYIYEGTEKIRIRVLYR